MIHRNSLGFPVVLVVVLIVLFSTAILNLKNIKMCGLQLPELSTYLKFDKVEKHRFNIFIVLKFLLYLALVGFL